MFSSCFSTVLGAIPNCSSKTKPASFRRLFLQIQIMADECGIIAVHSRRSVIQRGQQICPNIPNFGF